MRETVRRIKDRKIEVGQERKGIERGIARERK